MLTNRVSLWIMTLLATATLSAGCSSSEPRQPAAPMVEVTVGKGPDGLMLIGEERLALVANVEDTTLSVVDLDEEMVLATIPVGQSPWGIGRLGATTKLVVSVYGARRLVVVDEKSLRVDRRLDLSFRPTGLAVSRDGLTVYVAGDDDRLHAFDIQAGREFKSVPVGKDPDGVALTADGTAVWVTNTSGSISVIDLTNDWVETTIENPGKPEQIVAHPNRPLMFVSNYTENTVFIYETDTLELERKISGAEHGFKGPEEVRFSQDGARFFLAALESGNVSCFELASFHPCGQWPVGSGAIGVELFANDQRLVTTNYSDNTVTVVAIEPRAEAASP